MQNVYAERKLLRRLEKGWARFETLVNRLTGHEYNPFYHLGTLGIFLLVVITITGIYLTIFYRPGAEVAYATVERISAGWFGSLMRSIHRYASDAFLLVTVLHTLKILLSDRFWGSRWLAWVSGWGMVVLAWALGTMGYWLIWDQRGQWMTELLINTFGGGVALTFLSPEMAGSSFAAFVIVLFVHIFLPLGLLGLIMVHSLRLMRVRLWSPRWLMVLSLAGLTLLSLVAPSVSEAPADLGRFIEGVKLDAWYLGFLPLLDTLGSGWFWALTALLLGVSTFLPWITRGRHDGPAVIHEAECTGCGLCAAECPYRAIEMHYRSDDTSRFKSLAVINADLCTGCGLCVGTCATLGIELQGMPTEDVYENGLRAAVESRVAEMEAPVVVFTCQRQASLGSLPAELNGSQWHSELVVQGSPVYLGEWRRNGHTEATVTCVLPCIGMADVDWIKELNKKGAKDILLLGCPYDDCNTREGVMWEANRLLRRKSILKPNIQWRESAPGDTRPIPELMQVTMLDEDRKRKPEIVPPKIRHKQNPGILAGGIVLLLLSLLFASALPVDFQSRSALAGQSQVRVLLQHSGVISDSLDSSGATVPEGASVDAAQILGGSRYPVRVQIWIDGILAEEALFEPRGVRNEGEVTGMATFTLEPGSYAVELRLQDDGGSWRTLFKDNLSIGPSDIPTFFYDQEEDAFFLMD